MRILNDERVEYSKGKALELELLLNRIGSVFKPVEEETPDVESLQAALSAQVRKNEYKLTTTKACKERIGAARSKIQIRSPTKQNLSPIRNSLDSF